MKTISRQDIEEMERLYRVNFINSLTGFKSLNLIGTKSLNGNSNLAVFNTLFHLGSNPPVFGVMFRPTAVPRHTLSNLLETNYYTVNHINKEIIDDAHKTSGKYDIHESEFDNVDLDEEYLNDFYAPYVAESTIKFGVKFVEKHDIKINDTIIIVGEVIDVHLNEDLILEDGFIDIQRAGTSAGSGCDAYYDTKKLKRYNYYKPKNELEESQLF
jgi:flavin reductase (DIM6/NTAB) family NADH-FMN oxidoreductase RutF